MKHVETEYYRQIILSMTFGKHDFEVQTNKGA